METNSIINKAANNIRILSAAMVEQAGSGHPGGAMGGADFINILYTEFLRFDPSDMRWHMRDRLYLDPGHMSPLLYSVLALFDKYTIDELKNFRQWGSPTQGHPEVDFDRGIENTSGPLGQGHVFAVGAAIAERFLAARFGEWLSHKIYAYISDGGIQEEIAQGAGRIAGHLGLSNLIMFYDANEIQLSTKVCEVSSEDTAKKYEAWGWHVITINGNDADEIRNALKQANTQNQKPTLIIGRTVMGKGAIGPNGESFEGLTSTHGQPLSKAGASFQNTVKNLGGNPDNPFAIFLEVKEYYKQIVEQKIKYASEQKMIERQWRNKNPELAAKLNQFLSGRIPEIDFNQIPQKHGIATRTASANVLAYLAKHIENMIVASADLSNSDKTDGFLKNSKPLTKGDFSGGFLNIGVSELTMAALANGMALHGGVIPVCGTFFVFSDYMKPAMRLAALMQLPVIYVLTHDSFRVGEDGPTHQPIEQEAQIRLLEQIKNHSGKPSLIALRPADAFETTYAWKMALENRNSPTALILTRQDIKQIPSAPYEVHKGAYAIRECPNPDVILIASGSEVATLIDVAEILETNEKLKVRVVSVISEAIFKMQPIDYITELLPNNKPIFGLTAGLPITLLSLVGKNGKVFGLEHFGYSAPAKVLDEKFGFTPQQVAQQVLTFLNSQQK